MDVVQDWASFALHHGQAYSGYLGTLYYYTSTAQAYLLPLIDRLTKNPDLTTIILALIILFISLRILNMLWQALMFWVRLVRRVVLWGGLVAAGLWIYNRGADGAMDDVGHWAAVWTKEYEYWKERAETAKLSAERAGYGGQEARQAKSWF